MEDKSIITLEEMAESDARADTIVKQVNDSVGHGGLLAFERSAVDA